jgi:hypothetical protein
MCELYAAQDLVIPNQSTDWREWGDGLGSIDVFTNEAIPRTDQYEEWSEWAMAMVNAVNPSTAST